MSRRASRRTIVLMIAMAAVVSAEALPLPRAGAPEAGVLLNGIVLRGTEKAAYGKFKREQFEAFQRWPGNRLTVLERASFRTALRTGDTAEARRILSSQEVGDDSLLNSQLEGLREVLDPDHREQFDTNAAYVRELVAASRLKAANWRLGIR